MDRRTFVAALAALPSAAASAEALNPPLELQETIALWPGVPPGAGTVLPTLRVDEQSPSPDAFRNRVLTGVARPVLYVVRPERPDGSALLVIPGGGYREEYVDNEGFDIAARFSAAGVTCFVLVYRLPAEGWQVARDVPLQDAQRAMRLIRANAAGYALDPERVGAIGFSAGGHLAASLAVRSNTAVYATQDAADVLNAKPAFAALFYPVITMLPPYAHEASREMLLGNSPSTALRAAYSCERLVTADMPAMFLVDALDDDYVAPENTLAMFAALRAAKVPVEMHLFERGGHGFAIRGAASLPAASWPDLLLKWGASRGIFRSA
jgi:acetyl esterase/lipase